MDDGSRREGEREGETGSMSDCCSRGWAGLTGCHSHRDTMPQPQRGGGAVCAAAQGWGEVDECVCVLMGGGLFCTNQAFSASPSGNKRCNNNKNQGCYCWQHCSMSNINVRRSCCERAHRQIMWYLPQAPCWVQSYRVTGAIQKWRPAFYQSKPPSLTFLLYFLGQMLFSVCSRLSRFTGFTCPQATWAKQQPWKYNIFAVTKGIDWHFWGICLIEQIDIVIATSSSWVSLA